MADIQFKFINKFGSPIYDFNGDMERGTTGGTLDFWNIQANSGGTSGSFFRVNTPVYFNQFSGSFAKALSFDDVGTFYAETSGFTIPNGTYTLVAWTKGASPTAGTVRLFVADVVNAQLIGGTIIASATAVNGITPFRGYNFGFTGITGQIVTVFIGLAGGVLAGWHLDKIDLLRQGNGTIDYTVDSQDMPIFPFGAEIVQKQIKFESYYGRTWTYRVAKKRRWNFNFQEVSENCKNQFQGLLEQAEDIYFYDNINNVDGTLGATHVVAIDPNTFHPESPYFNVWNFQIVLDEVESFGF